MQRWIIGLSAVLGYPAAIAFGVPFYILLRWRGWNRLLTYVAGGASLGLVVYLTYFAVVLLSDLLANRFTNLVEAISNTSPPVIPAGMISGAVAGTTFWLIARPDRARV